MKLENVKHHIDEYFKKVDPLELVKYFENLGYEFEPITNDIFLCSETIEDEMVFVADYMEIKGNYLFEDTFYGGAEVLYQEKTLLKSPSNDFSEGNEGNTVYAMAA
jgi:hypothetical protein